MNVIFTTLVVSLLLLSGCATSPTSKYSQDYLSLIASNPALQTQLGKVGLQTSHLNTVDAKETVEKQLSQELLNWRTAYTEKQQYFVLEKTGGQWRLVAIQNQEPALKNNENRLILVLTPETPSLLAKFD